MNYVNDDYFLGHLLKQARKTNINRLDVDILKNFAEPKELLIEPVLNSIEHWNKWFPKLVENSGSKMDFVSSAKMTITFDLKNTRPLFNRPDFFENPFVCEMTIIDDRGKIYQHKHDGWWYPETK